MRVVNTVLHDTQIYIGLFNLIDCSLGQGEPQAQAATKQDINKYTKRKKKHKIMIYQNTWQLPY